MAAAAVGDDVYGEDPTVNALETLAAQKVGMEAALFVASGTMGNITGILSHANRGDQMVVGHDSHVMLWESGSVAGLGGIFPKTLETDDIGRMKIEAVASIVNSDDVHWPRHRLIHVENSYGNRGGYPIPVTYFSEIRDVADQYGLSVHMDGARLFNATTALEIDPAELTQYVDSVTFCISKGLCAPVGSILCGSKTFIQKARRIRKSLGGGMRQAGILAAAGMVSLNEMIDRLPDDHKNAQYLANGLAKIPGIRVDLEKVKTNIVFFDLTDEIVSSPKEIAKRVRQKANIWVGSEGSRGFRAVTHYWIHKQDVELFLNVLEDSLHN